MNEKLRALVANPQFKGLLLADPHFKETMIENNGSLGGEHDHVNDKSLAHKKGNDAEVAQLENSPPLIIVKSPGDSTGSAKRSRLKKWRRIKREFDEDADADASINVDTSKTLKRGLSSSEVNSTKPQNLFGDMKQKSKGSASFTSAMVSSPGVAVDDFALHSSNLDSRLAVGSTFTAGMDSGNNEDWSSNSFRAVSVPKLSYDIPMVVGYAHDKNRMGSPNGKNLGNSVQWGKGWIETSKKPREEQVKIEKENSHSSKESDLRTSDFVFMQGNNPITSNGRQSGRSIKYDGENSDEAQGGEKPFSKELQTSYSKEHAQEYGDLSLDNLAADLSWEVKEEKSENHSSSSYQDPLVESIIELQSAQEALEKEVLKLRENGNEHIILSDDSTQSSSFASEFTSVDPNTFEASSSHQLHCRDTKQTSSDSLENQVINLEQNVNLLESKIEEARATLKEKETKVVALEATLGSTWSPSEEMRSNIELQKRIYREREAELEGLFKQKIEAEVEYLVISTTIEKRRVAAMDQIILSEQQTPLAWEQAQMLSKIGDVGSSALPKLKNYHRDIVESDEVSKLQKRIWKVTKCVFIQLVFLLFVLQLSPRYEGGVVPT